MCFNSLKGKATVKNVSGDTVIGEQAEPTLWLQTSTYGIYQWLLNLRLALFCRWFE